MSEQSIYNLLTRDVGLEVIPAALEYGLGIIPWSPLHTGLLGRRGLLLGRPAGSAGAEGRGHWKRTRAASGPDQRYEDLADDWAISQETSGSGGCLALQPP